MDTNKEKNWQAPFKPSKEQIRSFHLLRNNRCFGNWSTPGFGKTASALLASRELRLKTTVIICPNSVKSTWVKEIRQCYPKNSNIIVYKKLYQFDDIDLSNDDIFNYIIINYEKFQIESKNNGKNLINKLLSLDKIDLLCLDEIHLVKGSGKKEVKDSHRRENILLLRAKAEEKNSKIYVYGMTATPIINNIGEVKSIIELITGKEHSEIQNRLTKANCITAHTALKLYGVRFKREKLKTIDITVDVNGVNYKEDILRILINNKNSPLKLEGLLTKIKLDDKNVTDEFTPGTIIYCQYVNNIISQIEQKLNDLKISYTRYTGRENSEERTLNLKKFVNKKADILIASQPVSTGVDGLQKVCNKMIVFSFPQTGAIWEQLEGRINRQGSLFENVRIIRPIVFIPKNTGKWSWDERKWNNIMAKVNLSDIILDGNFDKIDGLDKTNFYKYIHDKLLNDLNNDPENSKLLTVEPTYTSKEYKHSESVIKNIHKKANTSTHQKLHDYFLHNPDAWVEYHKQREIAKSKWEEDPVDVIAAELNNRKDAPNVIADLGCGLAKLSKLINEPNKVISVDHCSNDENVIKSDMANLSQYIDDKEVDITVFCLSLWGKNYLDYIKEAYRITAKRGLMYIVEPKDNERYDIDTLSNLINEIGFNMIEQRIRGKFVYLTFIKN